MGILFPNEAVVRRWDGALQARLCRAPLEAFLRARALAPAPAGISQDTDNLVRATEWIVTAGFTVYFRDPQEELAFSQRAVVGHVACLVSLALAEQIARPDAWRIVALVSTAQLLRPWIGLNAASMASASAVRQFQEEGMQAVSALDTQIMKSTRDALNPNCVQAIASISANIAARLAMTSPAAGACVSEDSLEPKTALQSKV
jgi:hypothetical protein